MTEEQNKLAEEIELSLDLNSSPRLSLNQWKQIIAALRREPATEAVLADTEKMLLTRQSWLDEGRREGLEEAASLAYNYAVSGSEGFTARKIAQAIRALKGKGASQGDKTADTAENFPDGGWHD